MPTNLLINHNIHFSVNGGYTDWDPWSPCTGYCGSGLQTRTRSCSNPEPAYNGAGCAGASEETQDCEHSTPCSGLFIDTVHFVDAINGAMYRVPPPTPTHYILWYSPIRVRVIDFHLLRFSSSYLVEMELKSSELKSSCSN